MGLPLRQAKEAPANEASAMPVIKEAVAPESLSNDERFERYLDRYRNAIFTYIYRLIRDPHLAEDITQETFVRLYREMENIRDNTASAWMYRVARNLVTDAKRKKKPVLFTVLRGGSRQDDDGDESRVLQFADQGQRPDEISYGAELRELADGVLARMSDTLLDPLFLCDFEGLTYEQASQVLGCSVKTVSSRLHKAREFVQGCLARHINPAQE